MLHDENQCYQNNAKLLQSICNIQVLACLTWEAACLESLNGFSKLSCVHSTVSGISKLGKNLLFLNLVILHIRFIILKWQFSAHL